MQEEWKSKGILLQELDALHHRIAELEQSGEIPKAGGLKQIDGTLGTMLDNINVGMLLVEVEKKQLVTGNKMSCTMLGCQQKTISKLKLEDVHPRKVADQIIEQAEKLTKGKPSLICNIPVRREDGSIILADITLVPLTLSGQRYILSVFRKTFTKRPKSPQPQDDSADFLETPHLTKTETMVLKLIVHGKSNKEIARWLLRSPRTIENHRAHLMKKLAVNNSVELVRRAVAMGFIDLPVESQQESSA